MCCWLQVCRSHLCLGFVGVCVRVRVRVRVCGERQERLRARECVHRFESWALSAKKILGRLTVRPYSVL
jgi:hypothetical protein